MKTSTKILFIFGTRPEAIKMCPLIYEFRKHTGRFDVRVCATAQHREMLDQVLDVFGIVPDHDLNIMGREQSLTDITSSVIVRAERMLKAGRPDYVFVQGDTTTTFAMSMAAFYQKVKIAHVEAGLRTHKKYSPYPEEMNRRLTSSLADLHFCPTEENRSNLLREGVPPDNIFVTGNTVIDALCMTEKKLHSISTNQFSEFHGIDFGKKVILVTGHRRENFGKGFVNICNALKQLAERRKDIEIIYPVHLNINVREPVFNIIGDIPNIRLLEPLNYVPFVYLMKRSFLVLTDSGGIQEEAPALATPVLVMRNVTERPEAVTAGTARLVGTRQEEIVEQTINLLDNAEEYDRMSKAVNPYGDGGASKRIVARFLDILEHHGQ